MTSIDRAALDACVTRATQQVVVRCALYLGDEELTPVSLGGGSVKADARRTQTRDASLELLPDGTHDVDDLYRLVSVPGTTVKLWRGFVLADASELLVPLGVFVVEDAELKETSSGSSLSVSCADLSVRIARAVWSDPLQIAAGTNLAAAITSILENRWPLVATDMPEELYLETLGAQVTLGTSTSSDPWADACALAEAHGYKLMFDADGMAVLRAQPSATTAPVFSFAPGATAIMTERSRATKLSETYNGVIATGEGSEITTPVRAEAWDDDPTSPTYRYGLFGQVPYLYSSSLLTTQAKAQAAADAKLAQLLGRSTSLSWSQIVHPGLAPLDVVEVETVTSRTVTRPRPGTPATLVPHHTNTDSDRATWPDLSGEGHDGTLTGFAWTTASGWAGSGTDSSPYCLVFGSDDDKVTVAASSDFQLSEYSLDVWMRSDLEDYDLCIFNNGTYSKFLRWHNTYCFLQQRIGGTVRQMYFGDDPEIGVDNLCHVVATVKDGEQRFYVDGVEDEAARQSYAGVVDTGSGQAITLGLKDGDAWPGALASARLYGRVLTPAEVAHNHAAGPNGRGYAKDDLALDLNAARVIPGSAPIPGGVTVTTETKRYILDSIDMPLSIGGTMSATARELRT